MTKEMIISSNGHQTLVAILEDDLVTEVFVERESQRGVVGNVYKARVSKILPGMQSAFVDIGLERDGFLYVSDVVDTLERFEQLEGGEDEDDLAEARPAAEREGGPASREGGRSPAEADSPAEDADLAEARSPERREAGRSPAEADSPASREAGRSPAEADSPASREGGRREPRQEAKIEDLLHEGQEVIVQVAKEPLGTKGARLTSHVTLAGRFLVFMPTVDHVGVSRKIESREERARLRAIVRDFREQHGFTGGVIIRTAAEGHNQQDIFGDLAYFQRIWTEVRQKVEKSRAPAAIYREQGLVSKLLRDLLSEDFVAVRVDDEEVYREVRDVVERIMPNLLGRVKLYTKSFPIFEEYGVQSEIDKALRSKVWLKSGGYIVINQTEALVAIDVNTGRYVGKRNGRLEDTIVKTNLEAIREIVRQIRLRDLGGIIVLDFIDMEERKNRQKVFQALDQELRKDRSPSKAVQVSDFGLIIITRKRVKQSLERVMTEPCPYCSGSGVIKSSATICYEILEELKKVGPELNGHGVLLRVNPDIARALKEEERGVLRELQETLGKEVTIKPDAHLHHEQFDVMAI